MNGWLIFGLAILTYCAVDRICECIEKTQNDKDQYYR